MAGGKPPPTPTLAQTMPSIKEDGAGHFDNFEWSKLDEYASYLHEQDAMRQKLGQHDMQKKLRADLDKQVADQRRKKNRQREEEQKYFHNQMVLREAGCSLILSAQNLICNCWKFGVSALECSGGIRTALYL